jgi:hypothetical protein
LCQKHGFVGQYYKRLLLSYWAFLSFYLLDREKSIYYQTEYHALRLGKIFAGKIWD